MGEIECARVALVRKVMRWAHRIERRHIVHGEKSGLDANTLQVAASHRRTLRIGGYATGRLYT